MDTMIDFILWMGNYPISATGFQDIDALVLGMLSYFDLSALFDGEPSARLRDCQRLIDADAVRVEIVGKDMGYRDILKAAVRSRRYGDLLLTDYVDLLRDDPPLQFAAVTFRDGDLCCAAFRGTDSSLAGWREDFMIAFSHTEAQELARRYVARVVSPGQRCVLCGHSKGGNLALYAACTAEAGVFERIERLYILDSPGLCPEVMDLKCMRRIEDKAMHIIPEFSIIGKLFAPQIPNTRIVRSGAIGFLQHSLATWGVDHGSLRAAPENDPLSCWISDVIDKWIRNMSREDRIVFINDLFESLSAGGAKTIEDLMALKWKGYESIRQRFQLSSDVTRRILADLPRQAILGSFAPHHRDGEASQDGTCE